MNKLFLLYKYKRNIWFTAYLSLKKYTRGRVENVFLGLTSKNTEIYFIKSTVRRLPGDDISKEMFKSSFNLINNFIIKKLKLKKMYRLFHEYLFDSITLNPKMLKQYDYDFKWLFFELSIEFYNNFFKKIEKLYGIDSIFKPLLKAVTDDDVIVDKYNYFNPTYCYIFSIYNNFFFRQNHWCIQIFPEKCQLKINEEDSMIRLIYDHDIDEWYWRLDVDEVNLLSKYFQIWVYNDVQNLEKKLKTFWSDEVENMYLTIIEKQKKIIYLPKGMTLTEYGNQYAESTKQRIEDYYNNTDYLRYVTSPKELAAARKLLPARISSNVDYKKLIGNEKIIPDKFPAFEKAKRDELKKKKRQLLFDKILYRMNKLSGVSDEFLKDYDVMEPIKYLQRVQQSLKKKV